jgi:hypothetical protein
METILDQWLARTHLGRRAALSTHPIEILVKSLQQQNESYLPLFWDEALQDIRALRLSLLSNTREGILSQPIWYTYYLQFKNQKSSFENYGKATTPY